MPFTTLFLAHVPDADAKTHRCVIETPHLYKLIVVLVKSQEEALKVSRNAVREEGVQSILLCPGFTHGDIAELSHAVGEDVSLCVARGDGPSNAIALDAMRNAGWFERSD